MVSETLKIAVKLSPDKSYEIAHKAGILPCTLSKIVNEIDRIKFGDPRVIAVGRVLGIPAEECFQEDRANE